MSRRYLGLGVATAIVFIAFPALAGQLGDPAGPIAIKEWVKGEPIDIEAGRGKTIYVVEFWATWCGPCKTSIPHLTQIQKDYAGKGVVMMGITREDDIDKVRKFVQDMGEKMEYAVGIDDSDKTNNAYMKAFGARGIPHAFVVDKAGRIAWEGHPMAGIEEVLDALIAGDYDLEATKQTAKAKALLPVYEYLAAKTEEADLALEIAKRVIKYGQRDADVLHNLTSAIASHEDIQKEELDIALEAIKIAYELSEGNDPEVNETYHQILKKAGREKEAKAFRKEAIGAWLDENVKKEQ